MRGKVALVGALLVTTAACAGGREEIIETNVPLYMEAGVAEAGALAAPSASAVDGHSGLKSEDGSHR